MSSLSRTDPSQEGRRLMRRNTEEVWPRGWVRQSWVGMSSRDLGPEYRGKGRSGDLGGIASPFSGRGLEDMDGPNENDSLIHTGDVFYFLFLF